MCMSMSVCAKRKISLDTVVICPKAAVEQINFSISLWSVTHSHFPFLFLSLTHIMLIFLLTLYYVLITSSHVYFQCLDAFLDTIWCQIVCVRVSANIQTLMSDYWFLVILLLFSHSTWRHYFDVACFWAQLNYVGYNSIANYSFPLEQTHRLLC